MMLRGKIEAAQFHGNTTDNHNNRIVFFCLAPTAITTTAASNVEKRDVNTGESPFSHYITTYSPTYSNLFNGNSPGQQQKKLGSVKNEIQNQKS